MADRLEQDLNALKRMSNQLLLLGAFAEMGHSAVQVPAAAEADMPSLTAARPINNETIPNLFETISKRYVAIGDFSVQVGQRVQSEDELKTAITASGTLLPSGR